MRPGCYNTPAFLFNLFLSNMKKSDPVIIVEQVLEAPLADIWTFITEKRHMCQWFFSDIPSFDACKGFQTKFNVTSGKRVFPHVWEILEVIEYKKIVYSWSYDGYKGDSKVYFELFPEGKITRLKVSMEVLENFSDDIPEFRRESCEGGWKYFINDSLKKYVDNYMVA